MSPQSLWTYLILYAGTENSVHTVLLSVRPCQTENSISWLTYPSAQTENNIDDLRHCITKSRCSTVHTAVRDCLGWYEDMHVLVPLQMHALMAAGKLTTSAP